MQKDKGFWIGLSLINLSVIALFGLLMRSKVLYSIPFLDYRHLLSAHAYFALSGWVGLALLTLLVYDVLPSRLSQKKQYRSLLWGVQTGAAGMGLSFLFFGYHVVSVFFVLFYFGVTFVLGWVFMKDLNKAALQPAVRWLSMGAILSLLLSAPGPFGIAYIILTKSVNSLLYRDFSYGFLHLQYNGFFTLAVFAVFFSWYGKKGIPLPPATEKFSVFLLLSVLPSLFLALLWHNLTTFYLLGMIGCLLIAISVGYFTLIFRHSLQHSIIQRPAAKVFWILSFISFVAKMLLTTGTLEPNLGNAVYGARPMIIGFLHLVFLAFVSFFILGLLLEQEYFGQRRKGAGYPFYIFGAGVVLTELLLLIQGIAVMLHTNHPFFNWGLWAAAILLFVGAFTVMIAFHRAGKRRRARSIME